jgi:hypothetical protein
MSTRKAKNTASMYPVSRLTKNSSRELWVTFPSGKPERGLVFSSTLTRSEARRRAARELGVDFVRVCSRRVPSYRKLVR